MAQEGEHADGTFPPGTCLMRFQPGGVFPGPLLCLENVRTLWRAVNHPGSTDKPLLTNLLLSTLTSLFAHNMNRYLFNASLCREIVDWSMCLSSLCLHDCWLFLKKKGYNVMVATIQYHVTGCWGRA